jgi:hypothetical protein
MKNQKFSERITVYGSEKEIADAILALEPHRERLGVSEVPDRLFLQQLIETAKIKAAILYKGNSVTPLTKTLADLKRVIKANDMKKMSDHLYKVLHLNCGSIAHFNKAGWIDCYPTVQHLARFFRKNEFGENIAYHTPNWKADFSIVAREMLKMTEKLV